MNKIVKIIGFLLIGGGLVLLGFIYKPVVEQEIKYQQWRKIAPADEKITPVSTEFGLVVPKIGINIRVFANVDDQKPSQYLPLLTRGVAHAKGSSLPGQSGRVFIFGHSADTPLNIRRYNAVFYLISKLSAGDEIIVYYQNQKFVYQVIDKKIVAPSGVATVVNSLAGKTIILQTCTPPGTTINRLLVIGKEVE